MYITALLLFVERAAKQFEIGWRWRCENYRSFKDIRSHQHRLKIHPVKSFGEGATRRALLRKIPSYEQCIGEAPSGAY